MKGEADAVMVAVETVDLRRPPTGYTKRLPLALVTIVKDVVLDHEEVEGRDGWFKPQWRGRIELRFDL